MSKTRFIFALLLAALTALGTTDAQNLLVPESGEDVVYLLNGVDGSVLDSSFLDIAANSGGVSSTPIEALEVGDEIWVSDQVADRIWKFDRDGSFVGDLVAGEVDNIRGMELVGNTLYVAQGGTGAQPEGIVTIDVTTEMLTGSFDNGADDGDISYYDVLLHNNELLVSNADSGNDAIERFSLDGTFLGNFATSDGLDSFDFLQQLAEKTSDGNLLGGGFSVPAGVYEFQPDGTSLGIVAGLDAGPRGVYELPGGDILWTNGTFLATDSNTIVDGGSFRFISTTSAVPEPAGVMLLLPVLGLALATRQK